MFAIRFPNNLILPLELSPILVDDKKTGGFACFDNVRNYLGAFLFRKLMLKIIRTKISTYQCISFFKLNNFDEYMRMDKFIYKL